MQLVFLLRFLLIMNHENTYESLILINFLVSKGTPCKMSDRTNKMYAYK